MKTKTLPAVLAFVLLAPVAAWAQTWTGAPGAAVIDEESVGIYSASAGSLSYNTSGSTTSIVARYNLTDTTGLGTPGWTTLEFGAVDSSPSSEVVIRVFRTTLTGGNFVITFCASQDASGFQKWQCPLQSSINFNDGNVYHIQVTISRSSASVSPRFTGVRLF